MEENIMTAQNNHHVHPYLVFNSADLPDGRPLTFGMLREALAEADSTLDNVEVWVNIDHHVIRTPIERYWHSTARVTGVEVGPDHLVLEVMAEEPEEVGSWNGK
jgi:hypothetical protein